MLQIFNSMSGHKEVFKPLVPGTVRMYACGITVYDYCHLGHARMLIVFDMVRKYLRAAGYHVTFVRNITDIDDKIIARAAENNEPISELTARFIRAMWDDYAALGVERGDHEPRATEYVPAIVSMVNRLVRRGCAYVAPNNDVYFSVAKFADYGKLSHKKLEDLRAGARVEINEAKQDPLDFVLWKASKPGEPSWDSPWGPGRPGWHIECSAMAIKHLGETLDIHLGGEDLIFPHHENEIAQSESLTGKPFARFWVHARFLLIEADKMSKSLGNFFTLRDLVLMGHKPSSIRYLLASVPYRRQLNFTFDGLKQAAASVERVRNFKLRLESAQLPAGSNPDAVALANETSKKMTAALEDDLNTAEFLGALFEMIRQANALADAGELKKEDAKAMLAPVRQFDEIFDVLRDDDTERMRTIIEWGKREGRKIEGDAAALASNHFLSDEQVTELIEQHNSARKAKDFPRSDAIRKQLADSGILVENTKEGVRWKRK